jgi:hypothetical protein
MSRQFMYGTAMAVAMTVGLGAQSPSPQQYPESSKPQSASQEKDKSTPGRGQVLTLVGCLQSGDQSPSGAATGTAGSTASNRGPKFVLSDVTQSPTGKTGAEAGATGTAGTLASIPATLQLTASGNSSASWSKYLNHKVEVKGTLAPSMSGMESNPTGNPPSANPANPPSTNPANPPSANPEQPRTPGGTMSSSDMGPTLHVTSIKEVSATCSATK